jgi:hypothetical protein
MTRREWTEEDDKVIRCEGPKVSIQRLAVRLRRPNTAVIARSKVLDVQLKKLPRLSFAERAAFPDPLRPKGGKG